jgi:hypothetical protein
MSHKSESIFSSQSANSIGINTSTLESVFHVQLNELEAMLSGERERLGGVGVPFNHEPLSNTHTSFSDGRLIKLHLEDTGTSLATRHCACSHAVSALRVY